MKRTIITIIKMAPQTIKIMLWNAQSIYSTGTFGEFQKIVEETKPNIICLVETWLNPNKNLKLKGFQVFRKDRDANGGGIAILTKLELDAKSLNIPNVNNGLCEHLGITITFNNSPLNIVTLYNPHGNHGNRELCNELNQYMTGIQGKTILCGDFNARHPTWDTNGTNPAGTDLYQFISTARQLSLLTPQNLGTRKNFRGNGDSTIDLFIGDSSLIPVSTVTCCADAGGSDHYPTILELQGTVKWNPICFRGRWKIDPQLWARWICNLEKDDFVESRNIERDIATLSSRLIAAARETFKRSKGNYTIKHYAPWWNEQCSLARANRRRAKRILRRHYSIENHTNYKKCVANAKRIIKQTKKLYWRAVCEQLTATTPITKVWRTFNSIQGRAPPDTFPLQTRNPVGLTALEKANVMASHYSLTIGEIITLDDELAIIQEINLAIEIKEDLYNKDFTRHELDTAISSLPKNKAAGMDDIPYEFIIYLPEKAKSFLLGITIQCLREGIFPCSQKTSLILPFLKNGKDPSLPESYRPIALLPVIGKVLEKLIFNRLYWLMETNSKIPQYQAGFRIQRSAVDQLARLEHCIQCGMKNKKVVMVVYFDISKAFDRVPHLGLLVKAARNGVKGNLLEILKSFVDNRKFQVYVQGEYSDERGINAGVPQGAILSPLLFSIFISDIPTTQDVEYSAFADDICMFLTADNCTTAVELMQVALDRFKEWANKWKVNVCPEKSCAQYFTRQKVIQPPNLKYGDTSLQYVRHHKFLGVYLDSPTLTWKKHIEETVKICNKRIDIMKASSATTWGADRKTLLTIYRTFVRSKLEYGSVAYGSACKTLLNKLEVIQNTALRISVGALKTTPIPSLRCESNIYSIKDRFDFLIRKFFNKAHFLHDDNPIKSVLLRKHNAVASLNWNPDSNKKPAILRAEAVRLKLNLPLISNRENIILPSIPPWDRYIPKIQTQLAIRAKNTLPDNIIQAIFKITMDKRYSGFLQIYTDGSKSNENNIDYVGAAFHIPAHNLSVGCRLQGLHSITGAELIAINRSLQWISENLEPTQVVICTDSTAALLSIKAKQPDYLLLVSSCLALSKELKDRGFIINLQWVPSHCGISGNEMADKAAKTASKEGAINTIHKPFLNDHNSLLKQRLELHLKNRWAAEGRDTFLGKHKKEWESWPWAENKNRKAEVAMARLRLGHTKLRAHLHRFNIVDSPNCIHCRVPEDIHHFLLDCHRYHSHRCNLRQELGRLGIRTLSTEILLGGGNLDKEAKRKVAKALEQYVIGTGKLADI